MKLEQIKAMRSEMKQLQSGLAEKDERYRQLLDILKTMPKTENRNSYTTKILALVLHLFSHSFSFLFSSSLIDLGFV